jgi:divalent metal cation (Fe/Co/Zn/Cd) transporter
VTAAVPSPSRAVWLGRGITLEAVTVGYNVAEGAIAVAAGVAAGSVALTGFGIDSVIEVSSGILLWWRLRAELGAPPLAARVEARAARGAGALLLALGAYLLMDAVRRLATNDRPDVSLLGIALTALSLVVMPLLARAKLRAAAALGSRALRADAHETIVCAWLSFTTLAGLALNAVLGWWWADPLAALAMLPLIVREGIEALRGDDDED